MQPVAQTHDKPRLLFVDDEQRVLNSMRIMFRRQFDLYLASHGAEALDIVKDNDIDVIVADHRMPQMTGVEVLTKVRSMSPRTVRILLTGYADLDAVEGSINEGEVFRFLTKPCAPDQLRETVSLAAKLARETPAPPVPSPAESTDDTSVEIILESDSVVEISQQTPALAAPPAPRAERPAPAPATPAQSRTAREQAPFEPTATDVLMPPPAVLTLPAAAAAPAPAPAPARGPEARAQPAAASKPRIAKGLGVIVFANDEDVLQVVQAAVRGRLPVYGATNIVQVVKLLTEHHPGVLVTDISEDKATIQAMTARLKSHLPELVTIAVSQHRDVLDMVWLINHGQIFRFLRKPLSTGRCAISLQAALKHHRVLLKNPELVKRHAVANSDTGIVDGMLNKLKSVRRLWSSL
jgi:DNA-binding NtrC family response regulator